MRRPQLRDLISTFRCSYQVPPSVSGELVATTQQQKKQKKQFYKNDPPPDPTNFVQPRRYMPGGWIHEGDAVGPAYENLRKLFWGLRKTFFRKKTKGTPFSS